MARSRVKKASINLITTSIYEIITFICALILPRLILRNFGSTYNGITASVTQFLSLVSILRLGVAGATRVALYKTLASEDIAGTSAIVKATEKYMRKIGYVILAYIAVLAALYPMFTDTGLGYAEVAVLVVAAGIGTFAQYFFGITYETFLSADQSVYIFNIAQACCTLANTLISALLIYAGCSIQVVKLASACIFFLTPLTLNIYVSKKYNLDKKCEPDYTAIKNRKDVLASSLANIVHENTDIVVLTFFCDVKVVSVYTVYNLVMSALRKILSIFSTGTEAIFGDMWAKKQYDSIKRNLSLYEYVIGVFISVIFTATLMLIVPFVRLYTEGVTDANYILPIYALIITIAMACFCFRTPYLTLVQGAGHYKQTKRGAYFEAGLNLVSSIILVQFIGIVGTAVGTLLANIFRSFQYAFYIDNHIAKRGKMEVFKRAGWIIINILVSCFLTGILIGNRAETGWGAWCICGVTAVFISTIVTMATSYMFFRSDINETIGVAKRMLARKRRVK
jgi:hypothetical protein